MKKRILAIVLATTALVNLAPATATAKTAHTYKARGTVRNFTYSMQYEDGEKLTGRGFDIYTTDGNIWECPTRTQTCALRIGRRLLLKLTTTERQKTKLMILSLQLKKQNRF